MIYTSISSVCELCDLIFHLGIVVLQMQVVKTLIQRSACVEFPQLSCQWAYRS